MNDFITKIVGSLEDKKEWKAIEARAKALPQEYHVVYDEIKHYIWQGGTAVMNPIGLFERLVVLFEEGVANDKHVLEITGDDIAAFTDGLVRGEKTYMDELREKLNRDVAKKLGK